ncbi:bleomycin resistance protein [Wenjunlia vitaminophila]|uniref:Bleomycin resistance protein n=1 Tax=Wenjunlia vitaminophila TaxID=76728 RepID=A0A0T6LZH4_WENVI|nr:VOC family protein [Wenjunlia vitaminophila]KRV51432.1 bleomycin resistance protein [Wenjunlia vitaminophila]
MSEVMARPVQGTPCWVSLLARDLSTAQRFYGQLFDWEFRAGPQHFGPYCRALLGPHQVAGLGAIPAGRNLPVAWTMYVASDNADATAARIRDSGGTVAVGPLESDSAGRMAIAADPSGGVFGVWEPREHLGADLTGEPGSVAWNELLIRDASYVDAFYSLVFGYATEPVSSPFDWRLLLLVQGEAVAGISSMGAEMPPSTSPSWMTYFAVRDTDASVARAVELGGTMVSGPEDFGYGRRATLADPEGATFSVLESPRSRA